MGYINAPQIMEGKVMHGRLIPRRNAFSYGIYYIALPLSKMHEAPLPVNRAGPMNFRERDHGPRSGEALQPWAENILKQHDIPAGGEITLVCLPRILGYVFNPVSFWLCHDKQGALRAVLCEVHNTFGEDHTYLCAHSDRRPIAGTDTLEAEKLFHVSPFLPREGRYEFRFDITQSHFRVWIDYYNGAGEKQLITTLHGHWSAMTKQSLSAMFWRYPLITLKAIGLIHWQAVKLLGKGIRYIPRPRQKDSKLSTTR